jgi:hypothetical protein
VILGCYYVSNRGRASNCPSHFTHRSTVHDVIGTDRSWLSALELLLPSWIFNPLLWSQPQNTWSTIVPFLVLLSQPLYHSLAQVEDGGQYNLAINLVGLILFAGAYVWEGSQVCHFMMWIEFSGREDPFYLPKSDEFVSSVIFYVTKPA